MDTKMNTEPKLDALTATLMLENIFEENDMTPNTVPVEALAGFEDFRPRRFLLQRVILIGILIAWILVPVLFFKPAYEISQVSMNEQNLPVYTIQISTHLPVQEVTADLEGEDVQIYAKDSRTYAVEPKRNGMLNISVTSINRQTSYRTVEVKEVDETGPKLISSRIDDTRVYLKMAENGTGVAYENIYAVGSVSGQIILPLTYDKETGTIMFELPRERCDVYIPDKRGNALHLSMEMK